MKRILVCPFGGLNLLVTLSEMLKERNPRKYEITYLSFTEYDRLVYEKLGRDHVHIPPGEATGFLPEATLEEVTRFTQALPGVPDGPVATERIDRAAHFYGREIDSLIRHRSFDHVLLFNGRFNMVVTVLDLLADRHGIPKLVFEQGLFRPDYITIDGRGVNALNSVQSLEGLLSPDPYPYQRTELWTDLLELLPLSRGGVRDYKRKVSLIRLVAAYLRMKTQPRHRRFLRTAEGRDLLEAALFPAAGMRNPEGHMDQALQTEHYSHVILCPLQVESDTQVLLHSPWIRDMEQLMEIVSRAVATYNARGGGKACVLFKTHPMQPITSRQESGHAFIIDRPSVGEILSTACDLVVTLNSTVGIEAIAAQRPVITLGEAFYAFPGVVAAECRETSELPDCISHGLSEGAVDVQLQRRFVDALKHKYQVRLYA